MDFSLDFHIVPTTSKIRTGTFVVCRIVTDRANRSDLHERPVNCGVEGVPCVFSWPAVVLRQTTTVSRYNAGGSENCHEHGGEETHCDSVHQKRIEGMNVSPPDVGRKGLGCMRAIQSQNHLRFKPDFCVATIEITQASRHSNHYQEHLAVGGLLNLAVTRTRQLIILWDLPYLPNSLIHATLRWSTSSI